MSSGISRRLLELRLGLYLLASVFLLKPLLLVSVLALLAAAAVVAFTGHALAAAAVFALAILAPAFVFLRLPSNTSPNAEQHGRLPLQQFPALQELVNQTAAELDCTPPTRVLFRLSPQFRHWGAPDDPDDFDFSEGLLRIDLSRAGICSVFEFRCDLAKSMLQPRIPHWLVSRVVARVDTLDEALDRLPVSRLAGLRLTWLQALRERLMDTLRTWRLFSEIDTDRELAAHFGKRCVASWIEKSWFAEWVFPVYRQVWLEPAWERGYLPPTMEGFRRFHEETGSHWLQDTDADKPVNLESDHVLGEIARWQPHRMRLFALEPVPEVVANVYDTRTAADLLCDAAMEEAVVRREGGISPAEVLRPISWEDYPEHVVLAEIDDELHEQAELFEGKSLDDLPEIAATAPEFMYEMVMMPFLPPAFEDHLASMPNALSGYLIKQLLCRGWKMHFDLVKGVRLQEATNGRELDPTSVVHLLAEGGMTPQEFKKLVA